ncbi:thiamine phosphate synthase [Jiella pacifica]|uniref:Thiamine phosphate synthase n=1 Tax=Jiella pacifica TaxID=2696469 RepID=A0A6N9T243_9HYPH|nr:thiamine phosphate synthase [Jiella pacifica]NDW05380.1 thiamine phosphate synthase [Jiella pacifica]
MISNPIRPQLVLVTTPLTDADAESRMRAALSGGDVASVLIDPAGRDDDAFQAFAETLVPLIQAAGAAAIVIDDSRAAGRTKADGLHLSGGDLETLGDAVSRHQPRLIVGASGFETRHEALEAGELMPDYMLFGRFGAEAEAAPHPKSLALAEWWAEIVEVPCILLGGGDLATLEAAAETGAEFIALSEAVFGADADPEAAVRAANQTFDAFFERISQ